MQTHRPAEPPRDAIDGHPHTDVLLVEDDDLVRYGLKRLLTSTGRLCVAVASAEEAQQLLALHAPAFVITDFNLSGRWSGIDLLLWMWRSPRLHGIPVVLMTGADPAKAQFLLEAVGLGHVGVLAKPFEGRELRRALAESLLPQVPRSSEEYQRPPTR